MSNIEDAPNAINTPAQAAINTDNADSGAVATHTKPPTPISTMVIDTRLRHQNLLLSLSIALLTLALLLISIQSLIPANNTPIAAAMGVMLISQLLIAAVVLDVYSVFKRHAQLDRAMREAAR